MALLQKKNLKKKKIEYYNEPIPPQKTTRPFLVGGIIDQCNYYSYSYFNHFKTAHQGGLFYL